MKSYIINVIHIICNIIDNILNYKFYKIRLLLLLVVVMLIFYKNEGLCHHTGVGFDICMCISFK